MALRLAQTNGKYRMNHAYHRGRPVARGIKYEPNIYMPKFDKSKISAELMGKILVGTTKFFLPYRLSEINDDFIMRQNKMKFSLNSENIKKWLDDQKIKYEFITRPETMTYDDHDLARTREYFIPKKVLDHPLIGVPIFDNELLISNYERINDVTKWLDKLQKENPEAYVENYSYDDSSKIHFVNYWTASMWLELTADSVIDETDLAKFADKI